MEQLKNLTGTVAIVTGGTRGLGRAMTLALLGAGASVAVMARDQQRLDELRRGSDGELLPLKGDVASAGDLQHLVAHTQEAFGHIDVVVSNAASSAAELRVDWSDNPFRHLPFWELEPEHYERSFTINALAPFILARATVPSMVERGCGRLVYISTSLGTMIRPSQAAYGPSKAASEALAAIMAQDLEGTGVTSNVLLPGGAADTEAIPLGLRSLGSKLIPPDAMGPPIVWLASHASDGVTNMRFNAKLWDGALPPEEAASIAGSPAAWAAGLSSADRPNARELLNKQE